MAAAFPILLQSLSAIAAALALAGCGFALAAGRLVGRYRLSRPESRGSGRVALLKPLHGGEPNLRRNLETFLRQDHAAPAILWLGVQDEADAALPTAHALAAAHPGRVRLVLDPRRRGSNAKVGNVMNLADAAAGEGADVVIVTDSDIAVPPGWLSAVAAAVDEPRAGLASCLYFGTAARSGLPARLGAMGVSYGFLPQGAVGIAVGARPAMGSTLALRRETLEAIGGFAAVKDVLADDYELGRAVTGLGLKVVHPPVLVAHDSAESTLGELWRHELRWARTIRGLDPAGYGGSVVTHAVPLALLSLALAPAIWWSWTALAAAILARLWLKGRVDAVVGASSGPWWLLPFRDMLSLAVFVAAWFAARVDWRGSRFHVGRDGGLTPV